MRPLGFMFRNQCSFWVLFCISILWVLYKRLRECVNQQREIRGWIKIDVVRCRGTSPSSSRVINILKPLSV